MPPTIVHKTARKGGIGAVADGSLTRAIVVSKIGGDLYPVTAESPAAGKDRTARSGDCHDPRRHDTALHARSRRRIDRFLEEIL
jgi:hypothetical protein